MAYAPIIGGDVPRGFALQFENSNFDPASFATTPIELLSRDGQNSVLTHGTGFVWEAGGRAYLVTARHVLSGLNPFTNEPMDRSGFVPQECLIYPAVQVGGDVGRQEVRLRLVHTDDTPYWQEDPQFETFRTDISVLPIPSPAEGRLRTLNEGMSPETIMTMVGAECSILGYPSRNYGGLLTPIWRRAAMASEPAAAIDGKPMFLVDASTAPGFSGGPVLRRQYGALPIRDANGRISVDVARVLTTNLVGVYAGRLQNRSVGGEVPFVFYANRLPAIVANARRGRVVFRGLGDLR